MEDIHNRIFLNLVVQVGMPPLMMPTADNTTPYMGRMVTLVKGNTEAEKEDGPTSPQAKNPEKWAMAAEFVPGQVWGGASKQLDLFPLD